MSHQLSVVRVSRAWLAKTRKHMIVASIGSVETSLVAKQGKSLFYTEECRTTLRVVGAISLEI